MVRKTKKRFAMFIFTLMLFASLLGMSQNINALTETNDTFQSKNAVSLNDSSSGINPMASVIGSQYTIDADNAVTGTAGAIAMSLSDEEIIEETNAKAWLSSDPNVEGTVIVKDKSDLEIYDGTYEVVLGIAEEPETEIRVTIYVEDSDLSIAGILYGLDAKAIVMGTKDVQEMENNRELIRLAQVRAYLLLGLITVPTDDITVLDTDVQDTPGVYSTTFGLEDEVNLALEVPTIVVDKDHAFVGDQFAIAANDFTIDTTTAITLSDNDILRLSAAEFWKVDSGYSSGVNLEVKDGTVQTQQGVYEVTLGVTEEPGLGVLFDYAEVTIHVTVSGEVEQPVFSGLTSPVKIAPGDAFDPKAGVSVTDNKDTLTADDIVVTGYYDVNKEGVYVLTYTVTDSDNNTTTTKRLLVVSNGGVVAGEQYVIEAGNATTGTAGAMAMKLSDEEIIEATNAKAWLSNNPNAEGTVIVKDKSDLEIYDGTYQVVLGVAEEPETEITVTIYVDDSDLSIAGILYGLDARAIVLGTKDVQEMENTRELIRLSQVRAYLLLGLITVPTDDIRVLDTTMQATPGVYSTMFGLEDEVDLALDVPTIVVDKDHAYVGDFFAIAANDFTIDTTTAENLSNSDILTLSSAEYWKVDPSYLFGVNLEVRDGAVQAQPGVYDITLGVTEEPELGLYLNYAEVTIHVTVVDSQPEPVLNVTSPVEIAPGDTFDPKAGVTVSDDKDNLTVDDVVITGDYDINKEGVYVLTYTLTDSDDNTTSVKRLLVVNDGNIVIGTDYIVEARDFTISASDVDTSDSAIIAKAQAKAYSIETGELSAVQVNNLGGYNAAAGNYTITFSPTDESTTTTDITATVVNKDVIGEGTTYDIGANNIIVGQKEIQSLIDSDATLIFKAKVEAWEKGDYATKGTVEVSDKSELSTTPGSYEVTFNVTEEPATTITSNVTVRAEDYVYVGSDFAIAANDFTISTETATTLTDADIIDLSDAVMWKISEDPSLTGEIKVDGVVGTTPGVYNVDLYVEQGSGTGIIPDEARVTIQVTVTDVTLAEPMLNVTSPVVITPGDTFDPKAGVTVSDDKDPLTVDDVTVTGDYDVNKEGVYVLTYSVTDSDNNTTTAKRLLVVNASHIIVGTNYVIEAYDFSVSRADVDPTESVVIAKAKAKAYNVDTGEATGTVQIEDLGGYDAVTDEYNEYLISFSVLEEPSVLTYAIATVADNDEVVSGSIYAIGANNITVGQKEVQEFISDDSALIAATGADAWMNSAYDSVFGTVEVTDKSDLTTAPGSYEVTFNVAEEPTTQVTSTITVRAEDYVATGDQYMIVGNDFTINTTTAGTISDANIIANAMSSAWLIDNEATKGTVRVGTNNIQATPGVYDVQLYVGEETTTSITIKVTVSNGAAAELDVTSPIEIAPGDTFDPKTGVTISDDKDSLTVDDVVVTGDYDVNKEGVYVLTYTVTDSDNNTTTAKRVLVVNDGNIVVGTDYIIEAHDFIINASDVNTSNSAVISEAQAKAYDAETGEAATVQVNNLGGYSATAGAGNYTITFSPTAESTTTIDISATVINKDVIDEGTAYDLGANNIVVGKDDVAAMMEDTAAADQALIDAADAEAWAKDDYATKGTVEVSDKSELSTTPGSYEVTFNVAEEATTEATISVIVVDNDVVKEGTDYGIGADKIVLGTKDAQAITNNDEFIDLANANSWEKGAPDTPAGTVEVTDTDFDTAPGSYEVTFNVAEEPTTQVTSTITVRAEDYVATGDQYMIVGNDFTINTTTAGTISDANIIANAMSSAWLIDNEATKGTVRVGTNNIQATPGVYDVQLYVGEEPTTSITIQVTVSNGAAAELDVTSPVEIAPGDTFDPKAGVSVSDDKDPLTVDDVVVTGDYDVNKEGVYVLTYTVTDSDNNTTTAKRVLVVNDGNIVVGTDYIIEAYDFTINSSDVNTSNSAVITKAQAKAYDANTGAAATVQVNNLGGYSATAGNYTITLSPTAEPTTTIDITATVVVPATAILVVNNVDMFDTTTRLAGAVFRLEDANGAIIVDNIVPTFTGMATVNNLTAGEYYLVQVKAPSGYYLNSSKQRLVLAEGAYLKVVFKNEKQ